MRPAGVVNCSTPAGKPADAADLCSRFGRDGLRAVPWVTSVQDQSIERQSPRAASAATGSVSFSTGTDAPVRIASCAASPRASTTRQSAGTLLPASSSRMSPGTDLCPVHRQPLPMAQHCGVRASIWRIAAIAASALPSWARPLTALAIPTRQDHAGIDPVLWGVAVTAAAPGST